MNIFKSLLLGLLIVTFVCADDFFKKQTSFGGYGELHYNFTKEKDKKSKRKLDFHRFVLFFSHTWTEQLSLKSEVEIEHNLVHGGEGELELEQAYINYAFLNHKLNLKVGVLLSPVSYINYFHEPESFMSVERPRYANRVIPTTWFDNGISLGWNEKQWNFSATVLGGLDLHTVRDEKSKLRDGRAKGYKTNAHSLVYIASFGFIPALGFTVGGSFAHNQDNIDEGNMDTNNTNEELSAQILEGHIKYQDKRFYALVEGAWVFLDSKIGNKSYGYYVDFGVNLLPSRTSQKLFLWARHDKLHNDIGSQDVETENLVGLSYLPISHITYKIDYGVLKIGETKTTLFNMGVGYSF